MSQFALLDHLTTYKKSLNIEEISELEIPCMQLLEPFFDNTDLLKTSEASFTLQVILDYMNEKINIGDWKNVRLYLRKTITIATYFKLLTHASSKDCSESSFYKEALRIVDHGLLFGCPMDSVPQLLQNCATIITKAYESLVESGESSQTVPVPKPVDDNVETNIDILYCPSMEHFYKNYIVAEKPAVLRNCINQWPALTKWQDINYIKKVGGLRTVPVELGSKYTDKAWTQKLMTIEDFINEYVLQSNETKGYLAQYQLFEHIPQLKDDIREPEYCCFTDSDEATDINAWFGPQGTVSPLHFDPKRNLLAQVVGTKKVILFEPGDSEYLYPHPDEMLFNTARVDPRRPDLELYPNFSTARPHTCRLNSGDMLYIPPKWWHFVESLSVSFSVSFWWM